MSTGSDLPQTQNDSGEPLIIIVTGGSRGIGASTARLAASRGYVVCINYLNNDIAAQGVVGDIKRQGGMAFCIKADVADEPSVVGLFDRVQKYPGRLYGLVNNAAILETQMALVDMDAGRIDRVFATNVRGSLLCAREAVRRMAKSRGGRGGIIVNVSSAASRIGSAGEYIDYAASKGAIDTFTRGLANEVAQEGIRVNAVRPGFIDTEMHASGGEPNRLERIRSTIPLKRPGTSDEVARAIMWLLSDQSSYCTGTFIDIAGGR